jgi:hypothetical protein
MHKNPIRVVSRQASLPFKSKGTTNQTMEYHNRPQSSQRVQRQVACHSVNMQQVHVYELCNLKVVLPLVLEFMKRAADNQLWTQMHLTWKGPALRCLSLTATLPHSRTTHTSVSIKPALMSALVSTIDEALSRVTSSIHTYMHTLLKTYRYDMQHRTLLSINIGAHICTSISSFVDCIQSMKLAAILRTLKTCRLSCIIVGRLRWNLILARIASCCTKWFAVRPLLTPLCMFPPLALVVSQT